MLHNRAPCIERRRHCCPFVFWLLHFLAVRDSPRLGSIIHRFCWSNFLFFRQFSVRGNRMAYIKLEKNMPLERMANLLNRARNHNCLHRSNKNRSMHKFRAIFTDMRIPSLFIAFPVFPKNSTCSLLSNPIGLWLLISLAAAAAAHVFWKWFG